jgi:hypothetical protein
MCGGMLEYRGEDDIPRPRTAEELFKLRNGQEQERMKKSKANGTVWQEDYLR